MIPVPAGLKYRSFQEDGVRFLIDHPRAWLGDDMGLGKTIQICGMINAVPQINRTLVVCPSSVKLNWKKELEKWVSFCPQVGVAYGNHFPDTNIVIVNYDIMSRHYEATRRFTWDLMVADEAHYCKNIGAKRTQMVVGSNEFVPIPAHRAVAMTGTPIVNRPIELYPMLRYLAPHQFPDYHAFGNYFCGGLGEIIFQNFGSTANYQAFRIFCYKKGIKAKPRISAQHWDELRAFLPNPNVLQYRILDEYTGASNLDHLNALLKSTVMLRRLKRDVLKELPPKQRQIIEIKPDASVMRLIEMENKIVAERGMDEAFARSVYQDINEGNFAPEFGELSTVRRTLAEYKVKYLIQHLRSLPDKVVCFVHHKGTVDAIRAEFGDSCVVVDGRTTSNKKEEAKEAFQTDEDIRLFVGTTAAAEGITLTASSHVVMGEPQWVPGIVSQMEDRCHRIGQEGSVLVQHVVLSGSLDVRMLRTVIQKQEVIEQAVN